MLPWSGPLFLLAVLALGAMPPFGIFRSEFEIVEGGFASGRDTPAAVLIIGVTVAFFGLAATTTQMLLQPSPPAARRRRLPRGEPERLDGGPRGAGRRWSLIVLRRASRRPS